MKEISKTYNPVEVERKLITFWENNNFYKPKEGDSTNKYSVVIPPPNVTGNLTLGHILNNTIQDIYVRWKRMAGYNVLWLPGTDHAGIATQTKVEKRLKEDGISKYDIGREAFVKKVWEWKDIYHTNIKSQLVRMGASVDWSRERFTLDEGLSFAVKKVFVELYNKGYIYKGKRIINWDPSAQTALSDEEVNYVERKDKLYYIKYKLTDSDDYLSIATTRPETMLGDTAVAIHPDDERYKKFHGKKVILPLVNKEIPVITDEYVEREFGTGALKITPAHDPNDFEIGKKHGLEMLQVIDSSGKMNEFGLDYQGMDRFAARKKIVAKLEEDGLLVKTEDYVHNIGISERGETIVEPFLSDQWFVRMDELAKPALVAVQSGQIKFYPERWEKVYDHWMTNIRDWCISRQLWWGHQIPVWYHNTSGEIYCNIQPPQDIENWTQDPDVLDTWFSSWLWPFSTFGWPDETDDFKKFFPTDLLSTGPDIIFFWVARMIMASLEFTGKIPFHTVYFHNILRDDKGRKFSKSLGNSPDVIEVMDKYGTDALRFTVVYLAPQGVDVYFNEEKCEIGRNFANKIWNASRFIQMKLSEFASSEDVSYTHDIFDKWIESRLNSTIRDYTVSLNSYKINEAAKSLYEFIWGDFCDWYIEILKIKSYTNSQSGKIIFSKALEIFEKILKMLHPIMPFITEELWKDLFSKNENESISVTEFPEINSELIDESIEKEISSFQNVITAVRNLRAELNFPPSVKCDVYIYSPSAELINDKTDYIKSLCRINELTVMHNKEIKEATYKKVISSVVENFQVYIPFEGLIDIQQEINRTNKEIDRLNGFIRSLEKKLSNENFISKADSSVVENERKKLDDSKDKLHKLELHKETLVG